MQSLVQAFAITLSVIAIASISIPLANVQGQQILTLQQQPQPIETLADNILDLNISFANNTNATLIDELITEEQGNTIVAAINAILLSDDEALEDLELEEEELEPLAEEEETEEEDSSNGNGNDNGDNDGDDEPEPPIEHEPEPPITEEPELGDEEGESESEQELELEVITKGCADGLGYHKDGPYLCYPLDSIGEDPPEGQMFCAALGCPYNPPDMSKD